ncbi:MAG TPA: ISAs1 family transposase, partial [Kofleriaceae bacterium]
MNHFPRERGIPSFQRVPCNNASHDTFSRVFRLLDPAAFARAFDAFLDDLGAAGDGVLAIDGKTLRRSFDRAAGRSALHVVTAFGSGARVAIAQKAVPEGQNETLAARALLETLALDGLLVTGDAMHAHEGTARVILDRGGDYLFALKANRPAMLAEVEAFFADPPEPLAAFETTDADHGRIETRRHRVSHSTGWLFSDRRYAGEPRLPGLATLACVEATRSEPGRTSSSTRYYLSSATLTPEGFARAFDAFLDDLGAAGDGVLAIDGKTLRRSFDRAAGRSALHVVTAFGTGARVAIAQRAV